MNLGAILRRERKRQGLTLKVVAGRAGISEGFLSQVENDVNSPSVATLMNICTAIGVEAGEVLNQASSEERLVVVRGGEWDDLELPGSGFATVRFFAPESRRVIDSAVMKLSPGTTIPVRRNMRNAQETLAVFRGQVRLEHGERVVELTAGDAVHYFAEPQHQRITNTGDDAAVVFWVGTI